MSHGSDQPPRYWAPSAMKSDGTCPSCGRLLHTQAVKSLTGKSLRELAGEEARAPWHFKLLVVAVVVYLGWRVFQLVGIVG